MYSLKRELKLNNKEVSLMRGCSGFKRWVYNWALKLVKVSWEFKDIKASDAKRLDAAKKVFTNQVMQKPEYAWMKEYPSSIYQSAFQDLKEAFFRWRKGLAGMPVFKQKKKGDSFTVYKTSGVYPEKGKPALPFTNRVVLSGKKIQLPGLKQIFRLKEPIPYICASQTFTVSRSADRWFVCFTLDALELPHEVHPKGKVGIDLGIKAFATLSDGTVIDSPNPMRKAKTKLALAVSECGFYEFRRQLDYKQAHYGHRVEIVDRWFPSSKTCSSCQHIQPMPLNERVFDCQRCSIKIDRDLNASINLENAPEDKIGRAIPESNACGQVAADSPGRNRKRTSKQSRIG